MNTRALYWATKAITEGLFNLACTIGMIWAAAEDSIIGMIVWGLLVFWGGRDMNRALSKLKAEANRDTALGFTGPASKGDLL